MPRRRARAPRAEREPMSRVRETSERLNRKTGRGEGFLSLGGGSPPWDSLVFQTQAVKDRSHIRRAVRHAELVRDEPPQALRRQPNVGSLERPLDQLRDTRQRHQRSPAPRPGSQPRPASRPPRRDPLPDRFACDAEPARDLSLRGAACDHLHRLHPPRLEAPGVPRHIRSPHATIRTHSKDVRTSRVLGTVLARRPSCLASLSPRPRRRMRNDTVALLGYGRFGRALGQLLSDAGIEHRAYDAHDAHNASLPPEHRAESLRDLASGATFVVLAVPVARMRTALVDIRPHLAADQVVLDVGSVKVRPAAVLAEVLGDAIPWCPTHPLFGPVSLALAERPLRVVICPASSHRYGAHAAARVRELYERIGRELIDGVDREILGLLARRSQLQQRAAHAKAALGAPVLDGARETEIVGTRRAWADEMKLDGESVADVFRAILTMSRRTQRT